MAVQQIDDNHRTVTSNEAFVSENSWTFVEATTGAIGEHTVFSVTGDVLITLFGVCGVDLTGATATIAVGIDGSTAFLIDTEVGTGIDAGDIIQYDATPAAINTLSNSTVAVSGQDILLTVAEAAVTGGEITFYCLWRPLSNGASVVATTPA